MKNLIFPLAAVALVGACAPYPPNPAQPPAPLTAPDGQQSLTTEEQRQLQENRERLDRERRERELNGPNGGSSAPSTKPKYPTASAVPGKAGFVFNPYTHNIVDVKGIGSGKLVRDPEDNDPTHKFRVP